jgi:hypothetical protein
MEAEETCTAPSPWKLRCTQKQDLAEGRRQQKPATEARGGRNRKAASEADGMICLWL